MVLNCSHMILEPIKNSSVNIFFLLGCNYWAVTLAGILILFGLMFVSYRVASRYSRYPIIAPLFILLSSVALLDLFVIWRHSQYIILFFVMTIFYLTEINHKWKYQITTILFILSVLIHEFGILALIILIISMQKIREIKIPILVGVVLMIYFYGLIPGFNGFSLEVLNNILYTHGHLFGLFIGSWALLLKAPKGYRLFILLASLPMFFTELHIAERYLFQSIILLSPLVPVFIHDSKNYILILVAILINFYFLILPVTLHYFLGYNMFFLQWIFNGVVILLTTIVIARSRSLCRWKITIFQ